ncbi:MAG: S8 family peptidase [Gemmatimonadetes bacterium]|nr:S8 family peptidase [Gemmatimonadota bacterium]
MSACTDNGSGDGRTNRQPSCLERIGLVAVLFLSLSPWLGGSDLQAQDPVSLTPDMASKLSPALRTVLPAMSSGQRLPVIIQFVAPVPAPAGLRPPETLALLQSRANLALSTLTGLAPAGDTEIEVVERLWVVPAAIAEATAEGIIRLSSSPGVARVWLDEPLAVVLPPQASVFAQPAYTSQAMRTIGADAVWPGGVTGAGTTVAFFDSGVDGANAMLASRWRGRRTSVRAAWFDPFRGAGEPQDLNGHGTQVAAAAVGALPAGDTLRLPDGSTLVAATATDVVTGPAPEAEWIAARVFDTLAGGDYTRRSVLLQAFQWALDPDGNPSTDDAPDVINGSWGFAPGTSDIDACNDLIYDAVDAAEASGIAVLFATGNSGPAVGSVAAPAARDDSDLHSFGVGATAGVDPSITVADYSGRGPSPCAGGIKPDVVAPGTVPEVVASGPNSARLTGRAAQGTSFSVAQASGAIALLRQIRPGDNPQQLKRILMQTAGDLGAPGPDNDTGSGLVDVPAAVSRVGASFAGPLLQLAGALAAEDGIAIRIRNRAPETWPGGSIRLEPTPGSSGGALAEGAVPPIGPFGSLVIELPIVVVSDEAALRVTLQDVAGSVVLSRVILLAPPNVFGGFVLEDGDLRVGANDFGRLGKVAANSGFQWRGVELLTAGGLGIAAAGRVSDGFFVTTLGRSDQKDRPAAIDTDWAPQRPFTSVDVAGAMIVYDDFDALAPLQLEVRSELEATDQNDVGALTVTTWISNRSSSTISDLTPALLADWDLAGGENVRWSPELSALVAESRTGEGPLAILAGDGASVSPSDVPLGLPGPTGFYDEDSGVLWDVFTESAKLALIQNGAASGLPGATTATDRAALIALESVSVPAGGEVAARFWLLAAEDEASAGTRLAELRAEPIAPANGGGDQFVVDPPYPNPLTIGAGIMRFPVQVPAASVGAGATLVLEVYDLAGRLMYRQRESVTPTGSAPLLTWDGLLDGGRPAAAGVYMYVVSLDGDTRTGRLILVR